MNLNKSLDRAIGGFLSLCGVRVVRLAPTKVRGMDPIADIKFLLGNPADILIFDVGANDGGTVREFHKEFPTAQIVAFEPFSECFELLKKNFAGISAIRVENIALGNAAGAGKLNVFSGSRMNSLLDFDMQSENPLKSEFSQADTVEVQVESLDNFCRSKGFEKIDLLKIDTQGYDLNVLKGAAGLLKQHRVKIVFLEINFIPMYKHQPSFVEIHEFLTSMGYRLVDFYNQVRSGAHMTWCDACYIAVDSATSEFAG